MSPATKLLDRLEGVRSTGHGRWLARCPAHEDRSPSLSVRELDDGRVLLNDFGGCGTDAVLDALGLTFSDLYPEPLPRREGGYRPTQSRIPAGDILQALAHEITVAALILGDVVDGKRAPQPEELERLTLAASRIGKVAHGRA